jgi:hypothetical protein
MAEFDATFKQMEIHARGMTHGQLVEEVVRLQRAELEQEVAGIKQRQAADEAAEREAANAARLERETARAEKMETLRRGAWLSHIQEEMQAKDADVLWADVVDHAHRTTPATGWPASRPEENYALGPTTEDLEPAADVNETHLGKLAATKGYRT